MQPIRSRRVNIPAGQWVSIDQLLRALEDAHSITPAPAGTSRPLGSAPPAGDAFDETKPRRRPRRKRRAA